MDRIWRDALNWWPPYQMRAEANYGRQCSFYINWIIEWNFTIHIVFYCVTATASMWSDNFHSKHCQSAFRFGCACHRFEYRENLEYSRAFPVPRHAVNHILKSNHEVSSCTERFFKKKITIHSTREMVELLGDSFFVYHAPSGNTFRILPMTIKCGKERLKFQGKIKKLVPDDNNSESD